MNRKIIAGPVVPMRRGQPRPFYRMEAKGDSADLFLYDTIGGDWLGEGTTAKNFQRELKALGDVKTLNIFINSPGGDVFDGTAIFNMLDRHRARKVVTIDGIAASIASVIAMVGDEIIMPENALLMIHDPWGVTIGTADDHRKQAEALDKVRDAILTTYLNRTGIDEKKLKTMMAEETWMTAAEAVELGFADSTTAAVEMAALAKFDLSAFKHVPEQITTAVTAGSGGPGPSPAPDQPNTPHAKLVSVEARVQAMRAKGLVKA